MTTPIYNTDVTIYFICDGISTNTIIDSLKMSNRTQFYNKKSEKKGIFDYFFKETPKNNIDQLEYEEFPYLENNGIQEMYMCQENKIINNIINNPKNHLYTTLDYNSIESGLIINHSLLPSRIFPLPYMSNKTNIKNKKILDIFKKKFGSTPNEHKRYWNGKKINNDFLTLKQYIPEIDWRYIDKTSSSIPLYTYQFNQFLNILKEEILPYFLPSSVGHPIFVCNDRLIRDILKKITGIQFNKNKDIIEYSSVWEIHLNVEYHSISGVPNVKNINYKSFNKIYPTEYNYKNSLKYNNNRYHYTFFSNNFILFNSYLPIPISYIKLMHLRLSGNNKKIISKLLKKNNSNNDNKNDILTYSPENIIDKYLK
jgi:hypothetical protein